MGESGKDEGVITCLIAKQMRTGKGIQEQIYSIFIPKSERVTIGDPC